MSVSLSTPQKLSKESSLSGLKIASWTNRSGSIEYADLGILFTHSLRMKSLSLAVKERQIAAGRPQCFQRVAGSHGHLGELSRL